MVGIFLLIAVMGVGWIFSYQLKDLRLTPGSENPTLLTSATLKDSPTSLREAIFYQKLPNNAVWCQQREPEKLP